MVDFSIIIPVYNAADSLDRCIESVEAQTHMSWEIVLIDDGSTDSSLDVCYKWKAKDKRIKVIHQENLGAAAARNLGLSFAKGQYIQLLDSDDTLVESCLAELYLQLKKYSFPDLIEFQLHYIGPTGGENDQGTIMKEGYYDYNFLWDKFIPVHAWTVSDEKIEYNLFNVLRVIKREVLEKNQIRFRPEIRRWEDWLFAIEVFSKVDGFVVYPKPLYNYYGHVGGGLGGRYDPETFKYVIATFSNIENELGTRINHYTPYAIMKKAAMIERCIWEIYENEDGKTREELLKEVLDQEYVIDLIKRTNQSGGILFLKSKIEKGSASAYKPLMRYLYFKSAKQKARMQVKEIYQKIMRCKANG